MLVITIFSFTENRKLSEVKQWDLFLGKAIPNPRKQHLEMFITDSICVGETFAWATLIEIERKLSFVYIYVKSISGVNPIKTYLIVIELKLAKVLIDIKKDDYANLNMITKDCISTSLAHLFPIR